MSKALLCRLSATISAIASFGSNQQFLSTQPLQKARAAIGIIGAFVVTLGAVQIQYTRDKYIDETSIPPITSSKYYKINKNIIAFDYMICKLVIKCKNKCNNDVLINDTIIKPLEINGEYHYSTNELSQKYVSTCGINLEKCTFNYFFKNSTYYNYDTLIPLYNKYIRHPMITIKGDNLKLHNGITANGCITIHLHKNVKFIRIQGDEIFNEMYPNFYNGSCVSINEIVLKKSVIKNILIV
uniref:Uncharacterized protein n=1 Tax=Megaviridae environmental sample TaxID=1737588 RepID=A0A5J6VL39_9VIRU|nr:MAG: hypothetical protein [Megaviridae environmental sample]